LFLSLSAITNQIYFHTSTPFQIFG
jgi:hypothetical protein